MRLLEMKTKVISTIILLFMLWVTNPARACACPDEVKNTASTLSAAVLQAEPSDLCTDCGHKRSCCSTHPELAVTGGAVIELRQAIQIVVFAAYQSTFAFQQAPKKHNRLRAPPLIVKQVTPFTSKQVLLI